MTSSERDALLAELHAYAAQQVTGADAILDELELGSRVALSLAGAPSLAGTAAA